MKTLFYIGFFLLFVACTERMPNGLKAQISSENFLDTLYHPSKVENKAGIDFITITDYLDSSKKDYQNHSKRQVLKEIIDYRRPSANDWPIFVEKATDILSKKEGDKKGAIQLEIYKVNGTEFITAFFVDSTFSKVFGRIQL